ncbi:MAG: HTH-type transcriptional activator IlvY [Gammaproteobacteria bacterium]
MELRELQLFLHLSRSLHFGNTSREFHISPSSLTRVVQKLEHETGAPLFERDNRRVALTAAGEHFRGFAAQTIERWEDLQRELHRQSDVLSGRLSIFCSVTASYSFLHELLDQYRGRFPGVEIQLHTGDTALSIQRVLDEQEDIGIAARPDKVPDTLVFQPIRQSPLIFIAPRGSSPIRDILDASRVPGEALPWERLPMVLSESGIARDRVERWFAEQGIRPNVYAQVGGNEAIVSMVSLGFGVGVVPQLVVENSPMQSKIEVLQVYPQLEPFTIGLCVLRRKLHNPRIQAFWDMALEHIPVESPGEQSQSSGVRV